MKITRKTDNVNWTQIKIVAYVVDEFASPIDLSVDIISSQEQLEIGWDKEYFGSYDFEEAYLTHEGYKVNILSSGKNMEKPMYQAIFVAEDMKKIPTYVIV